MASRMFAPYMLATILLAAFVTKAASETFDYM